MKIEINGINYETRRCQRPDGSRGGWFVVDPVSGCTINRTGMTMQKYAIQDATELLNYYGNEPIIAARIAKSEAAQA